jgi:hypothetical protein
LPLHRDSGGIGRECGGGLHALSSDPPRFLCAD